VAHGEPSFKKVLKTLATALRKEMVTEPELRAILAEVEVESVKPFAGRSKNNSASESMRCPRCGGKLEELARSDAVLHTHPGMARLLLILFHEKKLYRCAKCGHMVEFSPWQRLKLKLCGKP